jgi:hypothetical protein
VRAEDPQLARKPPRQNAERHFANRDLDSHTILATRVSHFAEQLK